MADLFDAVIVGGGPAGLSAALILGRSRRRVVVCDDGRQRNRWSKEMHGYLTQDGINPADYLRKAHAEVDRYGVLMCHETVRSARIENSRFVVNLASGRELLGRKLLLATGVADRIPEIPGVQELYGLSIHHCPYCDGWEHRDAALGAYGKQGRAVGLALSLKTWSSDVVLLTDGPARIAPRDRERLVRAGVAIRREPIERVNGQEGKLTEVIFRGGAALAREAIFFTTGQDQSCQLARDLGCQFTRKGVVETSHLQETCIGGVYVAGDAARDVQLVIVAAAEGAKAGFAINTALQKEERG